MKIKLIKPCKIGQKKYSKGSEIIVLNALGKNLIRKKFAISKEFISLQEKEAEKISVLSAQEIIENLPTNAKKLKREIPKISNKIVLEFLSSDSRITVREAIAKRIEQIGH